MYNIRKYADCLAIHDDDTGASRPLTNEEAEKVKEEFSGLLEDKVISIFTDSITSIEISLPTPQSVKSL